MKSLQAEVPKKTGRKRTLPPRNTQINSLQTESFDVLIIGGGASGAGCAIDSVTRGKILYFVTFGYKNNNISGRIIINLKINVLRFENCTCGIG